MPLTVLEYKRGRKLGKLAKNLAKALPAIVAPALTLSNRKRHDGHVTPDDIIVWCGKGKKGSVNTPDLQIVIWAHDFPARKKDLEKRKDAIIKGIHAFLADYDRNVTGFVWVLLQPTAFGNI